MKKNFNIILLFLFLSLTLQVVSLQAKPLHIDDQYQVFEGKPINLKEAIGHKPIYLKFWATWCLDCRRELPSLQKTYEKYQDKIAIYAVNLNINETEEYIRQLKQKHNLTIPIVMDNNGSIASNFQFYGTPFHVLINAQGEVVYTTYKDDAALQQQLEQLTQTAGKPQKLKMPSSEKQTKIKSEKGISLLYLSATWCDWYMKDIHPEMSKNCIRATELMNQIYAQNTGLVLKAYVTHLWTEEKDLQEYLKKSAINYQVLIDANNRVAHQYQITQYPTLVVLENGNEIKRFSQFEDAENIKTYVQAVIHK